MSRWRSAPHLPMPSSTTAGAQRATSHWRITWPGNGGVATKHSFGLYAASPPATNPYALIDCQPQVEHRRRDAVAADWSGACTVEAATVVHDRNGPTHVLTAVLTSDGARGWARTTDPAVIDITSTDGLAGRLAHRTADGTMEIEA